MHFYFFSLSRARFAVKSSSIKRMSRWLYTRMLRADGLAPNEGSKSRQDEQVFHIPDF